MTDVAAAVIAASAALAGSTLSGVFGWVNARSIAAQADRREVEIVNRATKAEARVIAASLADDIRAQIETVRREDLLAERYDFREQFLEAWFERNELTLRRWADRLPMADLRRMILLVLECVDDGYVFDRQWLASYELYVNQVLTLAYDLASAGARGEDPDPETALAFDRLADDLAHARAERERERTEKNREANSSQD